MAMDISIIILSYNTRALTVACVQSVVTTLQKESIRAEIIVVDNASSDDSVIALHQAVKDFPNLAIQIIARTDNIGFTKGNNFGARLAKGQYFLFLNSDTKLESVDFSAILAMLQHNPAIGGYTGAVFLGNGLLDPACHRGFPTPWRSLCYFSGLEKLTKSIPLVNRIFGGYHLTHLPRTTLHEIDAPTGAFFIIPRTVFEAVGGFDEDYFMYGEDIDLAYRIKEKGYHIVFDPSQKIIHYKHASGLKQEKIQTVSKTKQYFYTSMKIFIRKHYVQKYPKWLIYCLMWIIDTKSG